MKIMETKANKDLPRDVLFHDRTEDMAPWQKTQYRIMQGINHVVNVAMDGHRELSTGKCLKMQYSDFLSLITDAFDETLVDGRRCLANETDDKNAALALYEDFIRIAEFANKAIKNIVNNPSREIKKIEVKFPAARAAGFTNRTMRWLATRPGRTVAEKISPENKVLTTKTVFSLDTKENRELMYLYKNLYEIILSHLKSTKCYKCNNYEIQCSRKWVGDMQKMLMAYSRIKKDELGVVKPEKQTVQNNKLMCDLNYKIIWDAVSLITHVEENIQDQFKNVPQRLTQLLYWVLLGGCLKDKRAKIYDYVGKFYDENINNCLIFDFGIIDNESSCFVKCGYDTVIFTDENEEFVQAVDFYCDDTSIEIKDPYETEGENRILTINVASYFDKMKKFFEGKEKQTER